MLNIGLIGIFVIWVFSCEKSDEGTHPLFSIDNLRIEQITASRAVVKFETSVDTTCEAEFGETNQTLDNTASDPAMAEGELSKAHEVPLEDLKASTTYFVRAKAADANGHFEYSMVTSFITAASQDASTDELNIGSLEQGATIIDVSSNFGGVANDATWGANSAIDGSMATEWASQGEGDKAKLLLFFGQNRTLTRVGFRSRKMTDGSSIITSFRLVFSDDSSQGPFDTPNPDNLYSFDLEPITTNTVWVETVTSTGGNTGIKEVQFFE